jgi:hypothetical protein
MGSKSKFISVLVVLVILACLGVLYWILKSKYAPTPQAETSKVPSFKSVEVLIQNPQLEVEFSESYWTEFQQELPKHLIASHVSKLKLVVSAQPQKYGWGVPGNPELRTFTYDFSLNQDILEVMIHLDKDNYTQTKRDVSYLRNYLLAAIADSVYRTNQSNPEVKIEDESAHIGSIQSFVECSVAKMKKYR